MPEEISLLTKEYPRFADGRIDYTRARVCFVTNCTVVYGDEVLLTYRSADVIAYPNTWNGISGFIDEIKPLDDLVKGELAEEVNIQAEDIKTLTTFPMMIQIDHDIDREWRVFPFLVELLRKPDIKTNWENKEARWVPRSKVLSLELLSFYAVTFQAVMKNNRE